jgi:hypothetical protein
MPFVADWEDLPQLEQHRIKVDTLHQGMPQEALHQGMLQETLHQAMSQET